MIVTSRLRLRPWRDSHREPFAAMLADAEVMHDLGGPVGRAAADAKLERYDATLRRLGIARLAIERHGGEFLGYAGVMPLEADHPSGGAWDVGWRLRRGAWGNGFATEAARAALGHAFACIETQEIVAFTAPGNLRSQAVMNRLGMHRDPSRDFTTSWGTRPWHGLVWVARPT